MLGERGFTTGVGAGSHLEMGDTSRRKTRSPHQRKQREKQRDRETEIERHQFASLGWSVSSREPPVSLTSQSTSVLVSLVQLPHSLKGNSG